MASTRVAWRTTRIVSEPIKRTMPGIERLLGLGCSSSVAFPFDCCRELCSDSTSYEEQFSVAGAISRSVSASALVSAASDCTSIHFAALFRSIITNLNTISTTISAIAIANTAWYPAFDNLSSKEY